jgi:nucleoside-diphosphate-sugar epimerase
MDRSPEDFLAAWDEDYRRGIRSIPMFAPGVAGAWSTQQRHHFIRVFFHIRGHFGEVLWALGNAVPDSRLKEIVLDNMRDELGGDGPAHERLYQELARALGCDLKTEYVEQQYYLPFARLYNDVQLHAIATQEWRCSVVGFAAGERLDNIDYPALRTIFESFGLTSPQLVFFDTHSHAEHFAGALAEQVRAIWAGDPGVVQAAFDQVRQLQLAMWQELSDTVCHYDPAVAHEAAKRPERVRPGPPDRETEPSVDAHYDPARSPALRSKYADIVALDTGERSRLDLALDDEGRRKIADAQGRYDWGGHVLVFGGNGFVGAHIVHRLLADPRVRRVTAIVRSRPEISGRERILETWAKYELPRSAVDLQKLMVADGSMCASRFGVSDRAYDELAREVDTVFNCAGSTDYVPPYLDLRTRWVLGFLGVIQFCFDQRVKQVIYTGSTIAHLYRAPEDFARRNSWWYSGYAQVKWVNQGILAGLARAGMRAVTCEAPYILGSTTVGKDPGYVYSFWRAIRLGAVMQLTWDGAFPAFSPVDIFVDAAVTNALSATPLPVVRPISPWPLRMADLAPLLNCRVVRWEEFLAEVREHATPSLMRIIPDDVPQLVEKTNLEPIYPAGYDIGRFPPPRKLAELYLTGLNLLSTSWRANASQTKET